MKKTMTKYVRILSFFILSIFLLTKDTTASPISKSFLKYMFEDAYFSIPAITYISSDNYNLGANEKTINFFGLDFEIPESERAQKKEFLSQKNIRYLNIRIRCLPFQKKKKYFFLLIVLAKIYIFCCCCDFILF